MAIHEPIGIEIKNRPGKNNAHHPSVGKYENDFTLPRPVFSEQICKDQIWANYHFQGSSLMAIHEPMGTEIKNRPRKNNAHHPSVKKYKNDFTVQYLDISKQI